ncbi:MAG: sigma-70 family RNA polymerase sigma factor [Candidatus Hydrogenedentes bacterium]|nr:sigma-70 family RNA polymerase sigma factor [Candidatus Hydrogenedentota bacterium]
MHKDDEDRATQVREALDRYERPLVRYALRYAGNLESARDAVQDTFLKLCSADADVMNGKLAGWLFTVCRNRALDARRKDNRTVPLDETIESMLQSPMPPPGAAMEADETRRMVCDEIDALAPAEREVILMKFHDGLTYREISQITGAPTATINYRMHALLTRIAERLQAKNAAP